jgi:4-hydroxyphenylacetate 3-hydroxylase C terminal
MSRGTCRPRQHLPVIVDDRTLMASSQLHQLMHITRELCGGQICVTPDPATFRNPETAPWMQILFDQRYLAGRGPPKTIGICARCVEFGLCRTSVDVPVLCTILTIRQPCRGLPQLQLDRNVTSGTKIGGSVGPGLAGGVTCRRPDGPERADGNEGQPDHPAAWLPYATRLGRILGISRLP